MLTLADLAHVACIIDASTGEPLPPGPSAQEVVERASASAQRLGTAPQLVDESVEDGGDASPIFGYECAELVERAAEVQQRLRERALSTL